MTWYGAIGLLAACTALHALGWYWLVQRPYRRKLALLVTRHQELTAALMVAEFKERAEAFEKAPAHP